MDVMLHKRCAKFVYVIPDGLSELMSDISREVIRTQPERMYTFIADYLDALMITRENARVAARLVDSIIRIGETTVELLLTTGLTKDEADRMATIIQNAFKQYMASKKEPRHTACDSVIDEEEEQDIVSNILDQYGDYIENETEAAAIIQRAFRAFREKHCREHQMLEGMIDWRVAARSAIYLYRKSGVTYEEANRAATLIKAAYKGYYTRRVMKRLLQEGRQLYEDDEDRFQGEEDMEELPYEDKPRWKHLFGQLGLSDDIDETSATTATSTDVADSIMDSVLKFIPSESEPGQASAGDWTDAFVGDQIIEGLEAGLDSEPMDGSGPAIQKSRDVQKELTMASGTMTATEKSSPEVTQFEEGEPALSRGRITDVEEGQGFIESTGELVGSPEELVGSPEELVGSPEEPVESFGELVGSPEEPASSPEEIVAGTEVTNPIEATEYSETVTDTDISTDAKEA